MSVRAQLAVLISAVVFLPLAAISVWGFRRVVEEKRAYVFDLVAREAQDQARLIRERVGHLDDKLALVARVAGEADRAQRQAMLDDALARFDEFVTLRARRRDEILFDARKPGRVASERSVAFPGNDGIGIFTTGSSETLTIGARYGTVEVAGEIVSSALVPATAGAGSARIVNASGAVLFSIGAPNQHVPSEAPRLAGAFTHTVDGATWLGSVAPVGIAGLFLRRELPEAEAFHALVDLRRRALFAGLGVAVLALAAIFAVARSLARPVEGLTRAAERIARGDFNVPVGAAHGPREVRHLARSFADMLEGLKDRDEKIQRATAQLVHSEKLAALGRLSAGVSHEVKNPLAGILGCAQLGERRNAADEQTSALFAAIAREAKRARGVLDKLLAFARSDEVDFGQLAVNEVVREAVEFSRHSLQLADVRVETDLSEALPPVFGSPDALKQVLLNLFLNAQEAMPKGGTLTVRTRINGAAKLYIDVADTGIGISADVRDRIFDPFFTTKPSGQGTGLGLSVSHGIVQRHGGDLYVDSSPGSGTTFTIALPLESHMAEEVAA